MTLKEQITGKFDKSLFNLKTKKDWKDIDSHIKDFIKNINKSEHIYTLFCCEGHHIGDTAYFMFNVDEIGWDLFFQQIVPELSDKLFIDRGYAIDLYKWTIAVKDNQYNAGISIYYDMQTFDGKIHFWKVINETFLKYFK